MLDKHRPLAPLARLQLQHHNVVGQQMLHDDTVPMPCLTPEIA